MPQTQIPLTKYKTFPASPLHSRQFSIIGVFMCPTVMNCVRRITASNVTRTKIIIIISGCNIKRPRNVFQSAMHIAKGKEKGGRRNVFQSARHIAI